MDYKACWEYQQRLFDTLLRAKGTPAEGAGYLLLVEHPAVYTLGKSGHAENLLVGEEYLRSIGAEFYHIDRGGDITFHGPGQLVCYPILDLERIGIGLREYIDTLEEAVIRTVAEYGIAAHWKYKQNGQGGGDEGRYEWVRRLLENQEGADAEEFIHSLKVDMFADEVFVFTPRGDVINLPAGATPIDFAYNIHSAVGNHMVAAKVNGRIVGFDYQLKSGELSLIHI